MKRIVSNISGSILAVLFLVQVSGLIVYANQIISDEEPFNIEITWGFDNYSSETSTLPVFINMQANNPDVAASGTIRLTYNSGDGRRTAYTEHYSLFSGRSECIVIDVANIRTHTEVLLEIFDSADKLLMSKTYLSLNQQIDDIFSGYIGDNASSMQYLQTMVVDTDLGYSKDIRMVDITNSPALNSAARLNTFDIIFTESQAVDRLSKNELTSLKNWVYDGGILVTGSAQEYTDLWEDFGVSFYNTNVSGEDQSTDFYQIASLGRGNVIFLYFDYTGKDLFYWQDAKENIHNILMKRASTTQLTQKFLHGSYPNIYQAESMLPNSVAVKDFSISKYVLIVALYIIIIGPVSYIILKKKERRYFLWGLIPCFAIIFLGIIYTASSDIRKDDPFFNHVVAIDYSGNIARENDSISLTLPQKGIYSFNIPDFYRLRYYYSNRYVVGSAPFNLLNENMITADGYDISYLSDSHETTININNTFAFSEWYFNTAREYYSSDNIDVYVSNNAGSYTIDITNHTEYDFDYSGIFVGDNLIDIGNLNAGDSVQYEQVSLTSGLTQSITALLDIDDLDERNIPVKKRQASSMIFDDRNSYKINTPVYFLGICNDFESHVLRNSNWEKYGVLLVTKSVQIDYTDTDGVIDIPDISELLYAYEIPEYTLYDYSYIYNEEEIVTYQIPEDITLTRIKTESLEDAFVYIYNYENNDYEILNLLQAGKNDNLEAYTQNRQIRIKYTLDNPISNYQIIKPLISLKGVVEQ